MKTKIFMTILILIIGVVFAAEAVAQKSVKVINMTERNLGLAKTPGDTSTYAFLEPGKSVMFFLPPFYIAYKEDGVKKTVTFTGEAENNKIILTEKMLKPEPEVKTTILFNKSNYAWLAKTGPLAGMYFSLDTVGQEYIFAEELPDYFEFNAKVWYKDEKIQRLGIVTAYRTEEKGMIYFTFRFDQAEKEKKERFPIVNVAGQQVYFRIGDKEILLNPFGRSKPIKVFPGWYYVEESHQQKTMILENGKLVEKQEIVTGDILIGVAFHQREVKVTPNLLTQKVQESVPPSKESEKKAALQTPANKPAIPIRRIK